MKIKAPLQLDGFLGASSPGWTQALDRLLAADDDSPIRGTSPEALAACCTKAGAAPITSKLLTVLACPEMTAAHCYTFRKQVCATLNGHTEVEVDLSQTTVMDCAGLGALIAIRNLTREKNGGAVRLTNPTSPVRQLLDLMRAGEIFEIVKTIQTTGI